MSTKKRSDPEEGGTHDAKISDSGYSNSCSNSQSQRSSGSSESRHSSSSGSSGYCGHPSTLGSTNETPQQPAKRKDKEHKKKKSNKVIAVNVTGEESVTAQTQSQISGVGTESRPQVAVAVAEGVAEPVTQESDHIEVREAQTPGSESEALQRAALSQTLSCITKLKSREKTPDDIELTSRADTVADKRSQEDIINCIKAESAHEEELQVVVSLRDGLVVYTSGNLTSLLGFPRDMWTGRSLIDFVHPKHRIAFASHITSVIASPPLDPTSTGHSGGFYCCLRGYRGLRGGFSVTERRVPYLPCRLSTRLKELPDRENSPILDPNNNRIFLLITASPVRSAYTYGEESCQSKFVTRHLANAQLSHVDPEVIHYLGFLPQDMVARSVFDFFHPEDMGLVKEFYQEVMKGQGQTHKSKPYRFLCQNGGFAVVETEISSFVNPWTRKLEFIIGQHTVLKGPANPDVTTPVAEPEALQLPEEVMKESKAIQEQIKALLSEPVSSGGESGKQQVSKRCKDLATFMETLMDTKPPDLKVDVLAEDPSFSERDSVMLGEISPHHDYYNSKSSSETPPSYNQLNYNENLQRFFESKPKTTFSDESGETKTVPAQVISGSSEGEEEQNNSRPSQPQPSSSPQRAGTKTPSGGTSSGGQSSEGVSNPQLSNREDQSNPGASKPQVKSVGPYHPPTLTEQLLTKHNEDMEKQMMQKHREQRSKGGEGKGKERHKPGHERTQEEVEGGGGQGVKRSGSHSWEGESHKRTAPGPSPALGVAVAGPGAGAENCGPIETQPQPQPISQPQSQQPQPQQGSKVKLWPPFSVGVTPLHTTQPNFTTAALASPLMPMYYVPESRTDTFRPPGSCSYLPQQGCGAVPYMPGMVYHPLAVFAPPPVPVVYSPLTVLPAPVFPSPPTIKGSFRQNNHTLSEKHKSSLGHMTSQPTKKPEHDAESISTSNVCDDSSIYSSFYSFLKTDKSDESMKSSPNNENEVEDMVWEKSERRNIGPIKKVAPWLEDVALNSELSHRYQLQDRELATLLAGDSAALLNTTQPSLVNEQLSQLYLELELAGLSRQLSLEEAITSSSDSSGEDAESPPPAASHLSKKKRYMEYDKMVIMFEENAPLPPPAVTMPCNE